MAHWTRLKVGRKAAIKFDLADIYGWEVAGHEGELTQERGDGAFLLRVPGKNGVWVMPEELAYVKA